MRPRDTRALPSARIRSPGPSVSSKHSVCSGEALQARSVALLVPFFISYQHVALPMHACLPFTPALHWLSRVALQHRGHDRRLALGRRAQRRTGVAEGPNLISSLETPSRPPWTPSPAATLMADRGTEAVRGCGAGAFVTFPLRIRGAAASAMTHIGPAGGFGDLGFSYSRTVAATVLAAVLTHGPINAVRGARADPMPTTNAARRPSDRVRAFRRQLVLRSCFHTEKPATDVGDPSSSGTH
ncbi:hypothetical protein C8J41_103269 [Sphingomonas sp. PP-CC-3G-468]|nr:hypothetical protein C8J41_103269 [Sphingomonas sp. PP-CC-3G-468]